MMFVCAVNSGENGTVMIDTLVFPIKSGNSPHNVPVRTYVTHSPFQQRLPG